MKILNLALFALALVVIVSGFVGAYGYDDYRYYEKTMVKTPYYTETHVVDRRDYNSRFDYYPASYNYWKYGPDWQNYRPYYYGDDYNRHFYGHDDHYYYKPYYNGRYYDWRYSPRYNW